MRLFASGRERRLWVWTLAVVVAIYSTLGLTGTLAEWLREHGFLDAAVFFLLGMFLVGATDHHARGQGTDRQSRDRRGDGELWPRI